MRIREIAQARVRCGSRKIRVLLNREGRNVGKYQAYRLCKEEGLMLKRMKRAGRRKASREHEEKLKATAHDQAWSMDFVSDQLQDGARECHQIGYTQGHLKENAPAYRHR